MGNLTVQPLRSLVFLQSMLGAMTDLITIAIDQGCVQIITGFATAGPVSDALQQLRPLLTAKGITLTEHQRRWDRLAWPFCGKGFFQLKSRIPSLLEMQAITREPRLL